MHPEAVELECEKLESPDVQPVVSFVPPGEPAAKARSNKLSFTSNSCFSSNKPNAVFLGIVP